MGINLGPIEINPETGEFHMRTDKTPPKKPGKPKKARSKGSKLALSAVITLLFGLFYYYFQLPAINVHDGALYVFIIMLCAVFCLCEVILGGFKADGFKDYIQHVRKSAAVPFYIVCLCLAVAIVGSIAGWKLFRARDYAALLDVEEGDFAAEVAEISFDQIPMLDKDSANVLANRKLGELSDLVSQFEVYGDSYQINYQGSPVRVTYLYYGDFFKWWGNTGNGIPAYLCIDMVTQEVTVKRLEEGIRYSPSEYFFRDLMRHLRFTYPTKMFYDVNFEIDDNGDPWWVATVITKKVGLFNGEDVAGAVLMDAQSGECTYYDVADVPTWVDRVYNAELLITQYDYRGMYGGGFWNSLFGQSGCTETTSGYNYIAQNDDVWMYTGVTSVTGDQGNIGFILVNQRTKEANYYPSAGAEEQSARSSAEGAVQQYKYASTFPLLLNIGGEPTYFMALKDASNLVKMYALVNVRQYQIVATGSSVTECVKNYESQLAQNGISAGSALDITGSSEVTARIQDIRSAVVGGNTVFYIRLEGEDFYFSAPAADFPEVVIFNVGDTLRITYEEAEGDIVPASSVDRP